MNATYPACEAGFDPARLSKDESELLKSAAAGLAFGDEDRDTVVQAALVRRLLTGEMPGLDSVSSPLRLTKVTISGELDLSDQTMTRSLFATGCKFDGPVRCLRSTLRYLEMRDCELGKDAQTGECVVIDQAILPQGISLEGSTVRGEVRIAFTRIEGCARLSGTKIHNALQSTDLNSAVNHGRYALNCEGSVVMGDLLLDQGFDAQGEVWLIGIRVVGDLYCDGGTFANPEGPDDDHARNALTLERSTVEGALFFTNVQSIEGGLLLGSLTVAVLIDDEKSWAKASHVSMNGFCFGSIGGDSSMRWRMRSAWLKNQEPFARQPWEQTISVLRGAGYDWDSECLAIELEHEIRNKVYRRKKGLGGLLLRGGHWTWGKMIGYGYRPMRTLWALLALWAVSWLLFHVAGQAGIFVPTDSAIYLNPGFDQCRTEIAGPARWVGCEALPREYASFNSGIYALDLILPVIDLHLETAWAPAGDTFFGAVARAWTWVDVLLGWAGSLALVAALTRLLQRS